MFGFVKQVFVSAIMLFRCNLSNVNPWKCVSTSNQECKIRPEIIIVTSIEPVFFLYSIKLSKCSGICNNINDPYAKMCVPDVVKNISVMYSVWFQEQTRQDIQPGMKGLYVSVD